MCSLDEWLADALAVDGKMSLFLSFGFQIKANSTGIERCGSHHLPSVTIERARKRGADLVTKAQQALADLRADAVEVTAHSKRPWTTFE